MTLNPINQLDYPTADIDPHSFEDLVAKLPDDEKLVSDYIWDQAWKNKNYIRSIIKQWFGWQGGTIHQVIEGIMEAKRERAGAK